MTWAGTYKAASFDLFNEDLSWATAFWYWRVHVHNKRPGVSLGHFGEATDAINGQLECLPKGPNIEKAKLRFILYKKVLDGLNLQVKPIEKGCY